MHHSPIEKFRACLHEAVEECHHDKERLRSNFDYYMKVFHYMCSDKGKEGEYSKGTYSVN